MIIMNKLIIRLGFMASSAYLFWVGVVTFYAEEVVWRPHLLLMVFALYGIAFCLLWLGASNRNPERHQVLILIGVILAILFRYLVEVYTFSIHPLMTDSFLLSDIAAHLLLLGENPYAWDLAAAFSDYRALPYLATPYLNGEQVSTLAYPALNFLLLVPFKWLGITESRLILVLTLIGMMILLYRNAPTPFKAIIILPLLVNPDYVSGSIGFVTDSVWCFLLLSMVAFWHKPKARALLFGLASAYKQHPWLLAPFLVMRLWLDDDDPDQVSPIRRVSRFVGLSLSAFLLVNGPFMLADPASWSRAVFNPLGEPLIYYGQGLSAVTQFGLLLWPKDFYLVVMLIVLITLALLYWLNFRLLKEVVWFFPALFMWFSYRSLQSYFIYWPLLLLMAMLNNWRWHGQIIPASEPRHPYSLPIVALALLGLIISFGYYASTATPLDIQLVRGEAVSIYHMNRLELQITNTSDKGLTPRVAVLSALHQPFAWPIESGPLYLEPGESGLYQLATDLPYRMINLRRGAQVVVTDASGDYRLRGVTTVQRDWSMVGSSLIFNANYLTWGAMPEGWQLDHNTTSHPTLRPVVSDLPAIELTLFPTTKSQEWQYVGLSQSIPFPVETLLAWVRPPFLADRAGGQSVYGLEFDDGQHRLWVLFGAEFEAPYLAENHYVLSQPAPLERWSQQPINLLELYTELDWPLPPLERMVRGDLELLTRRVTVRLLLSSRNQAEAAPISAQFGPLIAQSHPDTIPQRVAETVAHQAEYYLALGDLARSERNDEIAIKQYRQALSIEPTLAVAHFKVAEILFWQEDYINAEAAYQQAANHPDWQAASYKGIGWVRYNLGEYSEAQDYFKAALRSDPNLPDAYNGMGWSLLQDQQCLKAVTYFRQALTLQPHFPDTQRGLDACKGK